MQKISVKIERSFIQDGALRNDRFGRNQAVHHPLGGAIVTSRKPNFKLRHYPG